MLPLSTSNAPLLTKFELTSLTPSPVFSNWPLLMKAEAAVPTMLLLAPML
jgi:hypothetical protein